MLWISLLAFHLLPVSLKAQSLGIYPPLQTNTDNDRLSDSEELIQGTNPALTDTDGDFISDSDELLVTDTDPLLADTDLNGYTDYEDWLTLHPTLWDTNRNGMLEIRYAEHADNMSPFDDVWWPIGHLTDYDGDGISDRDEILFGNFNRYHYKRDDTDNDEIYDSEIWGGSEHWSGTDYDRDGLTASEETLAQTDPYNPDSDGDGLRDGLDLLVANPLLIDANSDGTSDYDQLMLYSYAGPYFVDEQALEVWFDIYLGNTPLGHLDWDRDGMTNVWEIANGLNPADPMDAYEDPDGDFLLNFEEYCGRTNPQMPLSLVSQNETINDIDPTSGLPVTRVVANDTEAVSGLPLPMGLMRENGLISGFDYDDDWDSDGYSNQAELAAVPPRNPRAVDVMDGDGDGLLDWWEDIKGLDKTTADENTNGAIDGGDDFDNDRLTNLQEFGYGTHPLKVDTDFDDLPDGWEVLMGLDPLSADGNEGGGGDPDNDGITNLAEMQSGKNPKKADNPVDFELKFYTAPYTASISQIDYSNPRNPDGDSTSEPNYSISSTNTFTSILNSAGGIEGLSNSSGIIQGAAPSISTLLNTVLKPILRPQSADHLVNGDYNYHRYQFTPVSGPFPGGSGPTRWDTGTTSHVANRTVIKLVSNVNLPAGHKQKLYPVVIQNNTIGSPITTTYQINPPITLEIPKNSTESTAIEPYNSLSITTNTNTEIKVYYITLDLVQINMPNWGEPNNTTDMGTNYGARSILEGGIAYITGEPTMPQLVASFKGFHNLNLDVSIDWKLEIKSERPERGTKDNKFYPASGYRTLSANEGWDIGAEFGTDFVGGKCKLYYKIGNTAEQTFEFYIRGKNPLDATAKAYAMNHSAAATYPYAWAMIQHESRQGNRSYNHFNSGADGPDHLERPKWHEPDGWGISQLDEPLGVSASTLEVYNWRKNIDKMYVELQDKKNIAISYLNFIQSKYPSKWENIPNSANSISNFPSVATNMTSLDASVVQLYNGAGVRIFVDNNGNIVSGKTKHAYASCWRFIPNNPSGQRWQFVPNQNNYVYKIIHDEFEGNKPVNE